MSHCKAVVTISTIQGYANGAYKTGLGLEEFTTELQRIEENIFPDSSISWLIYPGKAVYKTAWGSPKGGEDVFRLEADYTEYDKGTNIHDWKRNVFLHAEFLRTHFKQETVRVSFIDNVKTTVLR